MSDTSEHLKHGKNPYSRVSRLRDMFLSGNPIPAEELDPDSEIDDVAEVKNVVLRDLDIDIQRTPSFQSRFRQNLESFQSHLCRKRLVTGRPNKPAKPAKPTVPAKPGHPIDANPSSASLVTSQSHYETDPTSPTPETIDSAVVLNLSSKTEQGSPSELNEASCEENSTRRNGTLERDPLQNCKVDQRAHDFIVCKESFHHVAMGEAGGTLQKVLVASGSSDDSGNSTPHEDAELDTTYRPALATPLPTSVQVVDIDETGICHLQDGHYFYQMPGLPQLLDEAEEEGMVEEGNSPAAEEKQLDSETKHRVHFSLSPITVFSTHAPTDYDRRNNDIDPLSATAEYELEKRLEKMDQYPASLTKGKTGSFGISIVGMGMSTPYGQEKLGIYVKSVTPGSPAALHGILEKDQIVEVDGQSFVGVTQNFATQVLKNTKSEAHFVLARERKTVKVPDLKGQVDLKPEATSPDANGMPRDDSVEALRKLLSEASATAAKAQAEEKDYEEDELRDVLCDLVDNNNRRPKEDSRYLFREPISEDDDDDGEEEEEEGRHNLDNAILEEDEEDSDDDYGDDEEFAVTAEAVLALNSPSPYTKRKPTPMELMHQQRKGPVLEEMAQLLSRDPRSDNLLRLLALLYDKHCRAVKLRERVRSLAEQLTSHEAAADEAIERLCLRAHNFETRWKKACTERDELSKNLSRSLVHATCQMAPETQERSTGEVPSSPTIHRGVEAHSSQTELDSLKQQLAELHCQHEAAVKREQELQETHFAYVKSAEDRDCIYKKRINASQEKMEQLERQLATIFNPKEGVACEMAVESSATFMYSMFSMNSGSQPVQLVSSHQNHENTNTLSSFSALLPYDELNISEEDAHLTETPRETSTDRTEQEAGPDRVSTPESEDATQRSSNLKPYISERQVIVVDASSSNLEHGPALFPKPSIAARQSRSRSTSLERERLRPELERSLRFVSMIRPETQPVRPSSPSRNSRIDSMNGTFPYSSTYQLPRLVHSMTARSQPFVNLAACTNQPCNNNACCVKPTFFPDDSTKHAPTQPAEVPAPKPEAQQATQPQSETTVHQMPATNDPNVAKQAFSVPECTARINAHAVPPGRQWKQSNACADPVLSSCCCGRSVNQLPNAQRQHEQPPCFAPVPAANCHSKAVQAALSLGLNPEAVVSLWNEEHVAQWLQTLGFTATALACKCKGISGAKLFSLTVEELKALGTWNENHCEMLRQHITDLWEAQTHGFRSRQPAPAANTRRSLSPQWVAPCNVGPTPLHHCPYRRTQTATTAPRRLM